MTPVEMLIVGSLAVWRLSYLITEEEGPFSLADWVRSTIDPEQVTWVGRGLNCIWCVSFWVGGFGALVLALAGEVKWIWAPFLALAWAAGAVLVNHYVQVLRIVTKA